MRRNNGLTSTIAKIAAAALTIGIAGGTGAFAADADRMQDGGMTASYFQNGDPDGGVLQTDARRAPMVDEWALPAGLGLPEVQVDTNTGSFAGYLVGETMLIAVREDGLGLSWGTYDRETGRFSGYWIETGDVDCPDTLAAPAALLDAGFTFDAALDTWGTFDVAVTETEDGLVFDGALGVCGIPFGGPWAGTIG